MKFNKTLLFTAIFSLMAGSTFAQKAKVVSAYNYNKSYERDRECSELVKGIEAIEAATKDAKTSLFAKTWYYGGNLWFNAGVAEDTTCRTKFDDALTKAYDYYLKAIKFNIDDPAAKSLDLDNDADAMRFLGFLMNRETKYTDISYNREIFFNKFPYLAGAFLNYGGEAFGKGNYEDAKEYSLKSVEVNAFLGKVDSAGMYNGALAAERLKEYDEALELYNGLTDIKYGGAEIYLYIANIYSKIGDTAQQIESIQKGLEVYPSNSNLISEELSYLLRTGQAEKSMEKFGMAIKNDPTNATLYFNRGIIQEKLKRHDEAEQDYKKALELDPKFFNAAFNLGGMYYNLGAELNNEASNYGIKETAKFQAATTQANEYFAKAKPALETAHEIDPTEQNTMASLVKIYSIEGDETNYNAMKAKLLASQGK